MLLTTQYLEEADRLAERLAVIDHGRVIAEGTAADLKASVGGHDPRRSVRGEPTSTGRRDPAQLIAGRRLPTMEQTAPLREGPGQRSPRSC